MKKSVCLGQHIRRIVDGQHWNYSDFARAINCSRSSLYHIFNSDDISVKRLLQISRVLKYDFFSEIYDEPLAIEINGQQFIAIPICGNRSRTEILELLSKMLHRLEYE